MDRLAELDESASLRRKRKPECAMIARMLVPNDDVGAGPPVVLLRAGVADRRIWADLLAAVDAAGYRVIAMNLSACLSAPGSTRGCRL